MTTQPSKLRQIGEAVLTGFGLLGKLRDGMRRDRHDSLSLGALQAFDAALKRHERTNERNRALVGTQADVERRSHVIADSVTCPKCGQPHSAHKRDHVQDGLAVLAVQWGRPLPSNCPPEPPMPRRREAILATKAKRKLEGRTDDK